MTANDTLSSGTNYITEYSLYIMYYLQFNLKIYLSFKQIDKSAKENK